MTQNAASVALAISASAVLSLVAKATVVLATGLLLTKAMHRARAARRFVVLAWTFAVLSAVPIVVAFAPAIPVVVRETRQVAVSRLPDRALATSIDEPRLPASETATTWASIGSDRIGTLALTLWGIGVLVSLIPVLTTFRRLHALRRTARPWDSDDLRNVSGAQVLVHERLTAPITFGWRRPTVLLPGDVDRWPIANIQRALVHEMEHVRRCDWPVHVLARLVCAVYWFHPLVWAAWRQLHLEADRACDDAVADRHDAREFAEQLIALAGRIRPGVAAPALSMAGGNLVTRVNALLNPQQARGRSGHAFAIPMSLGAILVGGAVSTLEAVERTILEVPAAPIRIFDSKRPLPTITPTVERPRPLTGTQTPATAAPPAPGETQAAIQVPLPSPAIRVAWSFRDYVIGAADILSITYWHQKEMTGDYVVRPDGKITLPLLNDVEAAGLTPAQLRDRLTAVSAKIFDDPNITVAVKAINSRKVYISGGVARPGSYDLVAPLTVMQLIALSGGLREFVTGQGITIIRDQNGKITVFKFDYREVISGRNLERNIVLEPRDTVIVPE
jgi:polysaccharide export outer membrane protein